MKICGVVFDHFRPQQLFTRKYNKPDLSLIRWQSSVALNNYKIYFLINYITFLLFNRILFTVKRKKAPNHSPHRLIYGNIACRKQGQHIFPLPLMLYNHVVLRRLLGHHSCRRASKVCFRNLGSSSRIKCTYQAVAQLRRGLATSLM